MFLHRRRRRRRRVALGRPLEGFEEGRQPYQIGVIIFFCSRNKRGERYTVDLKKLFCSQWRVSCNKEPNTIENACGRMRQPPIVSTGHDFFVTIKWSPGSIGLFTTNLHCSQSVPFAGGCHSSTNRTSNDHIQAHISTILSSQALVTHWGTIASYNSHRHALLLSIAFYIVRTGYIVLQKTLVAEIRGV